MIPSHRLFRQNLPFFLTGLLGLLLVPACFLTHLRIVPSHASSTGFLITWAFQSILCSVLLYQFGIPGSWPALRKHVVRFLPGLMLIALMIFLFGWKIGFEVGIAGVALAEYQFRGCSWKRAGDAILPFLYLAFSIIVSIYFSSVIVTVRPCTEFDATLARADSWLLFGSSVPQLSNAVIRLCPFAEPIYYGMGGVMGAALLILCIAGDRRSAFRMAGAIQIAYLLSLVIFFFLPAQGPFVAAPLPSNLLTANIQSLSLWNATLLYHHAGWIEPPLAYYVAFPSLHVAQPLIAAWFLRRWRGPFYLTVAFCVFLAAAIVILRWHYVVDILGGLGVAALAVWIVSPRASTAPTQSEPAVAPSN